MDERLVQLSACISLGTTVAHAPASESGREYELDSYAALAGMYRELLPFTNPLSIWHPGDPWEPRPARFSLLNFGTRSPEHIRPPTAH
jgi:hypothetical protein